MLKITPRTKQVFVDLRKHPRYVRSAINTGLEKVGDIVTKEAKKGIENQPKSGRFYRYKGRLHQASAKGQYPANRDGALKSGIRSRRNRNILRLTSKEKYSTFLEDGTRKMRKRPFLIRAINDTSEQQLKTLIDEMSRRFKR